MNIDVKKLKNIEEELNDLDDHDVLFVDEDGANKYVIMPVKMYEELVEVPFDGDELLNNPAVRIISPSDIRLSYDEYENVKKQIDDAFEKIFKPKPETLN